MEKSKMNIPAIAGVEVAVKLYYEKIALTSKDITTLFPHISKTTVQRLKELARDTAAEHNLMQFSSKSVLTEPAYEAWGLNIDALERRLAKIRKYAD